MNNTIYVKKENIDKVDIYGERKITKVHQIHYPAKKFLWITLRPACVRFGSCATMSYDDSYATEEEALCHIHTWVRDSAIYGDDTQKTFYNQNEHILYLKPHVIVTMKDGTCYCSFFNTEEEVKMYVKLLGVPDNMFGLQYATKV